MVILGGGFGGIYAARELKRSPVRITLIDRRNHHLFQPLLYQVATAGLNPADIAYPIRSILRRQKNARVILAEARSIDTEARRILLDQGSIEYDHLIVATGATHSYFGHPEWAALAPGLKSIEDALDIRRRVFLAYEAAERETDPVLQAEWLTFVVVGGGPTGVELAGSLSEIAFHSMKRDFRAIDPTRSKIILLEGQDRVLPSYPVKLSAAARRQLEKLAVTVGTSKIVTSIDAHGVDIGGERIPARTVLWAAGVAASPLARSLGVPLDRAGRVLVGPDLAIPGHPEVFVVGDLAAAVQADGSLVPGVAQGAMQGGRHAARIIAAGARSKGAEIERPAFRYRDKGSLATIGRAAAVGDLGRIQLSGFLAWWFWWAIHVLFLIGFRNRLLVMFQWAWSYITFQRGARLITGEVGQLLPASEPLDGQQPGMHSSTTPVGVGQQRAAPGQSPSS